MPCRTNVEAAKSSYLVSLSLNILSLQNLRTSKVAQVKMHFSLVFLYLVFLYTKRLGPPPPLPLPAVQAKEGFLEEH